MLNHHTEELPTVDTITIDPVEKRNIHVSGQVMYSDGRVYQNGRVQLHSDVMETKTDENGWFLFKDVDPAEHTLSVLDKDGSHSKSTYICGTETRRDRISISRRIRTGNMLSIYQQRFATWN